MRGHEDLIRLRKAGKKPAGLVYVDDYPVLPKHTHWLKSGAIPSICTHGDDVGSLDLRFLVGLQVNVTGDNAKRVRSIAMACQKAGAEIVLACCGERLSVWTKEVGKWRSS